MSGKFENHKRKTKKRTGLWIILIAVLILLALLTAALTSEKPAALEEKAPVSETEITMAATTEVTEPVSQTETSKLRIPVRNGVEIVDIGAYTGIYMEDGSDELVSGILMIKIRNSGEDAVEYAQITMAVNGETAEFKCTTLKPGDTMVVLEKNRMTYDKTVDYTNADIACDTLALFQYDPVLQEDKIAVQILDGAINVTNISGKDISGQIAIYYKNKAAGVYYGGITYRIVLDKGLKADEIRQMMASHFSASGSEIVFVTVAQ